MLGIVSRLPVIRRLHRQRELSQLRQRIKLAHPLNVVLGGGATFYEGWIKTDQDVLDITLPSSWSSLFEPDSIDRLLSEHVFEHLSEDQCRAAFAECHRYLKPSGLLRLAVPDGNRRDADYVAEVAPPRDGHQSLFNIDTLPRLLEEAGFKVIPLEYFDRDEQFHARAWDERDGYIARSIRFDRQESFKRGDMFYTSLVIDAIKEG